jgi:hypothetical protein
MSQGHTRNKNNDGARVTRTAVGYRYGTDTGTGHRTSTATQAEERRLRVLLSVETVKKRLTYVLHTPHGLDV